MLYELITAILSSIPIGLRFQNPSQWSFMRSMNGFTVTFEVYREDRIELVTKFINFGDLINK